MLAALVACAGCSENAAGKSAAGNVPVSPGASPRDDAALEAAASVAQPAASNAGAPPETTSSGVKPAAAILNPAPEATAQPGAKVDGPRIYSKARFAWIQAYPRHSKGWIGYLGLGGSVALRGGSVERAKTVGSGGCDAWYAVEPQGYVCAGDAATLDPNDPVVVALAKDAPKLDSPWPYEYAESVGAPRYVEIPTEREQRKTEWNLPDHLEKIAAARAGQSADLLDKDLVGVDLKPAGVGAPELLRVSPLVREARKFVATGSTVAYTREFDAAGRTFLLGHDRALIPKDRVRPYPRAPFHGVELGSGVELPLAFFRKTERPKYKRGEGGEFVKTGESWPRHGWVALTGEEVGSGAERFLATREPGVYVLASDATVVARDAPIPSDKRDGSRKARGLRTWVEISVLSGWLIAYEGEKPVFATLISPGRGGIPQRGVDPLETASTPTGTYRVDGKFLTATMVSSTNELIVHTEVQYVQNFHGPHALHGAYWHEKWGELKSGGCVNLSPLDSKRVFEWTEPRIPPGWHGMRSVKDFGPATTVVIHR